MAHFQFGTDGQSSGGGGAGGNNGGGVAGFPGFGMPSQQPSIFAQNTAQPLENSQQRNIHMTSHRATTAQNTEFSFFILTELKSFTFMAAHCKKKKASGPANENGECGALPTKHRLTILGKSQLQ